MYQGETKVCICKDETVFLENEDGTDVKVDVIQVKVFKGYGILTMYKNRYTVISGFIILLATTIIQSCGTTQSYNGFGYS